MKAGIIVYIPYEIMTLYCFLTILCPANSSLASSSILWFIIGCGSCMIGYDRFITQNFEADSAKTKQRYWRKVEVHKECSFSNAFPAYRPSSQPSSAKKPPKNVSCLSLNDQAKPLPVVSERKQAVGI